MGQYDHYRTILLLKYNFQIYFIKSTAKKFYDLMIKYLKNTSKIFKTQKLILTKEQIANLIKLKFILG